MHDDITGHLHLCSEAEQKLNPSSMEARVGGRVEALSSFHAAVLPFLRLTPWSHCQVVGLLQYIMHSRAMYTCVVPYDTQRA